MKPFNLQECIAGKPVVTRDGRPYKFGAYNPEAGVPVQLVGWIGKVLYCHHKDGIDGATNSPDIISQNDLFMAPEKKEYWVCLYQNTVTGHFTVRLGDTKDTCLPDDGKYNKVITIQKIHEEEI